MTSVDQLDLFSLTTLFSHPLFTDLKRDIVDSFVAYHTENPQVFKVFHQFAEDLRRAGRKHYGASAIFERIRWHFAVETKAEDFKLNNNYRSCYPRLLIAMDPSFADFFETRHSPGTHREAA